MAFPDTVITDNEAAGAFLTNKAAEAGLNVSGLQPIAQLQSIVGNLLVSDPSTVNIPAGDILSGTFGANKSGGADTGTYAFPGVLNIAGVTSVGTTTGTAATLNLQTATGHARTIWFNTAAANRWGIQITSTTESGSNVGSDFTLLARADNGNAIGTAIAITRSTMATTLAGALTFTGGVTPASVGTATGTAATAQITASAIPGGNTTIVTTGTGGVGGAIAFTTGAGGTAALAATAGTGGAGGAYSVTTGAGAASAVTGSGTGTGGAGGAISLTTGIGGAASTSTGVNVGGASGTVAIATAAGGASTNGSSNTGGVSGAITLATGAGGAGATAQGASGAISLSTGASTASVGTISLNPGGLAVLTASWISATVGQVVIDGTYGAGVASIRLNGLTTAATNNLVGTLTNSPVTGDPTFWAPISVAGNIKYFPCW
jgi:hypothetical protein